MNYQELKEIEIEKLHFDLTNPRLPKRLYGAGEEKVIEWMLLDASLIDLIASIANNGFFPGEPLLAIEENNKFIIIEGNRRLAACKVLNNYNLATVKSKSIQLLIDESSVQNIPKKVPVFLFKERKDILAYLGYRHVTGVKSWGALPKAKYLFELFSLDTSDRPLKIKCQELAKKIGSRSDYVLKLLTSYNLFQILEDNSFFKIKDLSEETIEFSNLVDAATRFGNVSKYLNIDFNSPEPLENLDIDKFQKLSVWLFERDINGRTMIGENRNIRLLNDIIASPKAIKEFEETRNIRDAYLLTSIPDDIFSESIASAHKSLMTSKDVFEHVSDYIKEDSIATIESIKIIVKKMLKQLS